MQQFLLENELLRQLVDVLQKHYHFILTTDETQMEEIDILLIPALPHFTGEL